MTETNPDDATKAASALIASGRKDEAEVLLHKLLSSHPHHVAALEGLAGLARARSDRAGCIGHLRKAVDAAPARADLKIGLARELVAGGNPNDAATIARDVAGYSSLGAPARIEAAKLLRSLGRLDDAERASRSILEANPKLPAAMMELGVIAKLQERLTDAVEYLSAASKSDAPLLFACASKLPISTSIRDKRDRRSDPQLSCRGSGEISACTRSSPRSQPTDLCKATARRHVRPQVPA